MIKIYVKNQENINAWYVNEMIPVLQKKQKEQQEQKNGSVNEIPKEGFNGTTEVKNFLDELKNLTDKELTVLLTIPVWKMEKEAHNCYKLFGPYMEFALWYCNMKENGKIPAEENRNPWKKTFLSAHLFCEDTDTDGTKSVYELSEGKKKKIDVKLFIKAVGEDLKELNEQIRPLISYSFLSGKRKRELVKRLDIKVCPYCNQAFVFSLSDMDETEAEKAERTLGDLDHIYPKSIFQLFSLSLWNLIPACQSCNQRFKGSSIISLLNPLEEGFEEECHLEIVWGENFNVDQLTGFSDDFPLKVAWKINPMIDPERRKRIENNIKLFYLNEQYGVHQTMIRDLLRRRTIYQGAFKEEIKEILDKVSAEYGYMLLSEEYNRLLYGVSLDKTMDQNEIHGKMIRDLLQNGKR